MELYQLKTFVAVADEGHLTRAAKRLHASQPAVSAHIKSLEQELDVQLFQRTPRGMVLTRAGSRLLDRANRVLESVRDIKLTAAETKSHPSGKLKIALNIDPVHLRLDALLSYSRSTFPGLEYHLVQQMSWEAAEALASGRLDAAFVYGTPEDPSVDYLGLTQFDVMVVAPYQWRDRIRDATWETLGDLPWITTPDVCQFNRIARSLFEKAGIAPLSIAVADEEITISRLVASGCGLTLMIREEALALAGGKKLCIWDRKVATLPLYFVYLKRQDPPPHLAALVSSVKAVWERAEDSAR